MIKENIEGLDKDKNFVPVLHELPEMVIFTDELTYFVDEFRKLPYGILAFVSLGLKDIKNGSENEIDPTDFGMYEKIYYFIAGAMMSKQEKNLVISEDDIDRFEILIDQLTTKISLLEGYYAGILEAKYIEDEWMYGMGKELAQRFLKNYRNI